jgi:hypothetical protein
VVALSARAQKFACNGGESLMGENPSHESAEKQHSARENKIVVEAIIPAPVETVWQRSQEPDDHVRWDIRFAVIRYLPEKDERGFHLMDYRTSIAFGITVWGIGRYLHSMPLQHSTFEFDSEDWKSIIKHGRGIWLYKPCAGGTYFKTVYDYEARHGFLGRLLDRLIFRRTLQLATEWSFETLRVWCAGDDTATRRRRSRWKFTGFLLRRLLGFAPATGAARSWLGTGKIEECVYEQNVLQKADTVAVRKAIS